MGALGEMIRDNAAAVRELLGSTCTLNGTTALGKCGIDVMNPGRVRDALGDDYSDEQDMEWAMIETGATFTIVAGDAITVTATSRRYVVRRVTQPCPDDVLASNRCLCIAG